MFFNGSNNSIEVRNNRHINSFQNGSNNTIFTKRNGNNLILNNNNNNNNNSGNTSVFNYKGKNISVNFMGNNKEINKLRKISKKINKIFIFL